jgi:cysteinyl-tRNA synthetase
MATKYLGQPFDIHGGGWRTSFPTTSARSPRSRRPRRAFCNYWLLNNMVTVDGVKMGKSLGNFVTIKDALARHDPMTLRFFVLSSHYRSPTDFSRGGPGAAGRGLERLLRHRRPGARAAARCPEGEPDPAWAGKLEEYRGALPEAMDDDFGTPAGHRHPL